MTCTQPKIAPRAILSPWMALALFLFAGAAPGAEEDATQTPNVPTAELEASEGEVASAEDPATEETVNEDSQVTKGRKLGYDGLRRYKAGDFAEARELLEQAYLALPIPSIALWSARALAKTGRLRQAAQRYEEAQKLPVDLGDEGIQREARAQAGAERLRVLAQIPRLVVEVQGAQGSVGTISVEEQVLPLTDSEVSFELDPGRHVVIVRHGSSEQSRTIHLKPGDRERLSFSFEDLASASEKPKSTANSPGGSFGPTPEPEQRRPPRGRKVLGLLSLGVGVSAATAGGILGAMAINKRNKLNCDGGACAAPTTEGDIAAYDRLRLFSSVGIFSGAALMVTGAGLLLLSPKKQQSAWASPYVGVGELGVAGHY